MQRITYLALALGLCAGTAGAFAVPAAPLGAQSAPCSWGSSNQCMEQRVCVRTGFEFQLWPFKIGFTNCLEYRTYTLYYKDFPDDERPPSGSDPGDGGAPPGDGF